MQALGALGQYAAQQGAQNTAEAEGQQQSLMLGQTSPEEMPGQMIGQESKPWQPGPLMQNGQLQKSQGLLDLIQR